MEAKDLLPILFERSNATATLWNIELIMILGLLAFLGGTGKSIKHFPIQLALSLGFGVVAVFNSYSLIQVSEQRAALIALFRTLHPPVFSNVSGLIDPLYVPTRKVILGAHLLGGILVLIIIWTYPRYA
jgi:hypothetical protein